MKPRPQDISFVGTAGENIMLILPVINFRLALAFLYHQLSTSMLLHDARLLSELMPHIDNPQWTVAPGP
jgi:hypothetical protein